MKKSLATRRLSTPFTLVELLVVAVIIALLASALLGGVIRARNLGKRTSCVSNLDQLMKANHLYGLDYKCYVPGRPDGVTVTGTRWNGGRELQTEPWDTTKGIMYGYIQKNVKAAECPLKEMELSKATVSGVSYANFGSYGYNISGVGSLAYVNGYRSGSEAVTFPSGMRPEHIALPSQTVVFADAGHLRDGQVLECDEITPPFSLFEATPEKLKTKKPTISQIGSTMHFRHLDKADVAWVDGHVTPEQMAWSSDEARRSKGLGGVGPLDNSYYDPWSDDITTE